MSALTARSRLVAGAAAVLTLAVVSTVWPDRYADAQTAPSQKWTAKTAPADADQQAPRTAPKGEQSIVVLVNDEPITAYEVDQRAAFLALNAGAEPELKAKAEARWAQIVQDPKTNERFQQLLQDKNVQIREQAQDLQKQFLMGLQQNMLEQLQREARGSTLPRFRKQAQEELIDERLKVQAAKKVGIEVSDNEVKTFLKGLAERNKMTLEQFAQQIKSSGVDLATMGERFRAQRAWRELIGRRYSHQISVTQRDVDRVLSSAASEAGEDTVELQVQKISLALASKIDQTTMTKRYAEAEALRRKFGGCRTMGELAKSAPGAKFEDMRFVKPASIAEPMRSMLLSAKDGDMLPPVTTAAGVEVYAVCSRRAVSGNEAQRTKTLEELQTKELDILARTHMRNLRQEADIEYR